MDGTPPAPRPAHSSYRWVVCGLLLFSTTFNYLDRQVISYLKEYYCTPVSQGGFGWTNTDFANLTTAFTLFYAGMTVLAGWVIDKIGTKLGLALAAGLWSLFGMANAFAGTLVWVHIVIRSAFGVGEGGNFPASIKTVAEWFPKRERSLATGIFNAGANVGAMIAALFVPWCMVYFGYERGWKWAFILTGAIGLVWLIFWYWLYDTPERQTRLSAEERAHILSDGPEDSPEVAGVKVSWTKLFGYRQTWAFVMGKFLTDGTWWFYLFWLPDYLHKQFHMSTAGVRIPTFTVFGISIIGSVYGGGLPMVFIRKGLEVYTARLRSMLLIAIVPLIVVATQYLGDVSRFGTMAMYLAVGTICIAAAAHQAWSANLFTTVSDMFPKRAVGSVTGIGAMAGGVGGAVIQKLSGWLTDAFATKPETAYLVMFMVCAFSYLVAWASMKALVPRHRVITDL
jgi:MFS transporter, ACS family, hexuronate transporter